MVYRFLVTLTSSSVIIFLLSAGGQSWATEYIFSAPDELEQESAEIPASNQDYPMYECGEAYDNQGNPIDSHNCDCPDCESASHQPESEDQLTSEHNSYYQE